MYFHEESRKLYPNRVSPATVLPDRPVIEEARPVQIALNQVMQALVHRSIDYHDAAQILCGLQMAIGQVKSGK